MFFRILILGKLNYHNIRNTYIVSYLIICVNKCIQYIYNLCVCLSAHRRRHTKGCIACMYSRDNRQYFLFPSYLTNILTVVQGSVGGMQRKGYRVLYTVVVRFIARSRFVRSFVYCMCIQYIQYLHDDALGVLCVAHPSSSLVSP